MNADSRRRRASHAPATTRPSYCSATWIAVLAMALIPALTLCGCPAAADPPSPAGVSPRLAPAALARMEEKLLRLCNQARLDRSLPPVEILPGLSAAARRRAADLSQRRELSHRDAAGRDFRVDLVDPATGLASGWRDASEILARNRAADPAAEALRGWLLSPAHRQTVLDARYRRVGVGVAQDATGTHYFVMLWLSGN